MTADALAINNHDIDCAVKLVLIYKEEFNYLQQPSFGEWKKLQTYFSTS